MRVEHLVSGVADREASVEASTAALGVPLESPQQQAADLIDRSSGGVGFSSLDQPRGQDCRCGRRIGRSAPLSDGAWASTVRCFRLPIPTRWFR